jgi:hypothetical protein
LKIRTPDALAARMTIGTEIRNVGYYPDTHAARVTGQIGNRDAVDVQYDDTSRVGAANVDADATYATSSAFSSTNTLLNGMCRTRMRAGRHAAVPSPSDGFEATAGQ